MLKPALLLVLLTIWIQTSTCDDPDSWDYLVYSQRWPITACAEWEEKNKINTCNLPSPSLWTVHGIWPNKRGTEGPYNCKSGQAFDPKLLDPILGQLNVKWVNVEANTKTTSFWKHEWDKHGTCASQIPALGDIPKYFGKGLELNAEYNVFEMLAGSGIVPGNTGYDVHEIYSAIQGAVNAKPVVFCEVDKKTKEHLISEIRICFDKSLGVIDCDGNSPIHKGIIEDADIMTNCKLKAQVKYYKDLPVYYADSFYDYEDYEKRNAVNQLQKHMQFGNDLLDLYRYIRFLIWFTF